MVETLNHTDKLYFILPQTESAVFYCNIISDKVILVIPSLGKLQFFLASKSGFIVAIIIPAIVIITYDVYKIMKMIILKNQMSKLKNKNGNI